MVRLHQARGVSGSCSPTRVAKPRYHGRRFCVVCGALIASEQPAGHEYCSCHYVPPRNPRLDPGFDGLVLAYLCRARPRPLNLYPILGLDSRVQDHRDTLAESIDRWRKRGWFIRGIRSVGYVLVDSPQRGRKRPLR